MWIALGIAAYLLVGFIISVVVGRAGGFDYYPTPSQFRPGTLKYMILLFWVVFVLMAIVDIILSTPGYLNRKYNDLVKVRQ